MNQHHGPDVEVAIIGAGLAGVCAGIKLGDAGIPYLILEAADDIGGTWRANVYPGVQVDVASVAYSYSFEPNPDWSRAYARGPELKRYIDRCADKYGVRDRIRFGAEVTRAAFDEARDSWSLDLADGSTVSARFVISGWGSLARPKAPAIRGLDDFAGKVMHTAEWDSAHRLDDERVAVIGTGATGVQVAPAIAPLVARLTVFQRTAVWVLPRPDFPVPRPVRLMFRAVPATQAAVRALSAIANEAVFAKAAIRYRQMPQLVRCFEAVGRWWLRREVRDPELRERLTPRYGFGCKRPTLSNAYLKTFNRPNVELATSGIDHVTENAIVTVDGQVHELDTIILATGFKVFEPGGTPPIEVIGRDDTELGRFWHEHRYQSYEGVSVPRFPNLFMLSGPYALGGPSYIFMIETNVRHAVRCIAEARRRDATRAEVRQRAHDAYFREILRRQQDTVFFHNNCAQANSYYFDRHGDAPILRPASALEMWRRSATYDLDHYAFSSAQ